MDVFRFYKMHKHLYFAHVFYKSQACFIKTGTCNGNKTHAIYKKHVQFIKRLCYL